MNHVIHEENAHNKARMIRYGLTIIAIFVIISIVLTATIVQRQFILQKNSLAKEQFIQSSQRKESFAIWLTSLLEQGNKLINSDLFQLFSAEVARLEDRVEVLFSLGALNTILPEKKPLTKEDNALVAQLPLMQNLLREFIAYSDFISGRVVNKEYQIYLSSHKTPPPLTQAQQELVAHVFSTGKPLFAPLTITPNGIMLDIYFPIVSPYIENTQKKQIVAVLITSKLVGQEITKLLNTTQEGDATNTFYLLQQTNNEYITAQNTIVKIQSPLEVDATNIPFEQRFSITNKTLSVYSSGTDIEGTPWFLIQETPTSIIYANILSTVYSVLIFAVLATCIVILIFVALWWYLMQKEQRSLAQDFKSLYLVIDGQQQLLNGINSTITDMIVLTDVNDIIQYVNKAFAEKVEKAPEALLGLTMQEVFGFDTAKRITKHDSSILATGKPHSFEEVIFIKSEKHIFQIIRTPFQQGGETSSIVSVFRDITEMKANIEYTQKLLEQTVEALIQTVEMRDPYLAGHTHMMRTCVEGICKELECSSEEKQLMLIATDLSQIGKLFVPVEILTKTTPLSQEEKKILEEHVQHSLRIISGIEFKLPVAEVIAQMNERIDGSGYPAHLTEKEIRFEAKVVAIANSFCALVKPRSYRTALSVTDALDALEHQGGYDMAILHALEEFLQTEEGKNFITTQVKRNQRS